MGMHVTLDAAPLLAKMPADQESRLMLTPIVLTVTDNRDGTWSAIASIRPPVSLNYEIPGMAMMKTDYASVVVEGVFDESLGEFQASSTAEMTGMRSAERDPDGPVDGECRSRQAPLIQHGLGWWRSGRRRWRWTRPSTVRHPAFPSEIALPGNEGMPGMTLSATLAERIGGRDDRPDINQRGSMAVVAWFVAHPDQAAD